MIRILRRLLRGRDTLATIDAQTFNRWLEAGRPPLAEFCRRPEDEQETLAFLGCQHERAKALAIAKALHNPKLWEAEHFGSDDELEDAVADSMAQALYAEYLGGGGADEAGSSPDMGGALDAFEADQERQRRERTLRTRSSLMPVSIDAGEARA